MAFLESPRFPDDISAGSVFGPGYNTSKASNQGGFEMSNANWSMPLYEGDVGYQHLTQDQLDDLLAFFHRLQGMHDGFRFKNYSDYAASGAEGTVVQLTAETWQMYKTYTFGAATFSRKISKPIAGVVISGSGSYSYDLTTGIITDNSSPASAPSGWVGEFDCPVRFNTDKMLPQWITQEQYEWMSIPIVELRL